MRLTVFQSSKGDCLLLTNAARTARILVDAGMPASYTAHVAASLGRLRKTGKTIDLVYVSHIDRDHIGGVLEMLDNEAAWRVHEFQKQHGNTNSKPPGVPRPPKIGAIWHNAFHAQLKQNAGPVEDALAAIAPMLAGSDVPEVRQVALEQSELVTSVGDAIRVSRRISDGQLKIPLNPQAKGKLMMQRANQAPITLGGMRITILGPTTKHLNGLKKEWNEWLRTHKAELKKIRAAAKRDQANLGTSEFEGLLDSLRLQAESFGDPASVTPPNLASLTLLVEEGGQSILLTGDARGDQIVDGLKAAGRFPGSPPLVVDVLKVPHHGSEHNIDSDFCDAVIARDYIFCANGEDENPNLKVVEMMARRRLNVAGAGPCKFWFNSSEPASANAAAAHMAAVETLVRRLAQDSHGRLKFKFLTTGSSFEVK